MLSLKELIVSRRRQTDTAVLCSKRAKGKEQSLLKVEGGCLRVNDP